MSKEFKEAKPFAYRKFHSFYCIKDFEKTEKSDDWYHYSNLLEEKWATDKEELMSDKMTSTLRFLNSQFNLNYLEQTTGIFGLIPDPWMRGGGLHFMEKGGFLDIHSDFGIHPKLKLYRRLNLIIFLNEDWKPEYGGELELWDREMKEHISIEPQFGTSVLFETSKYSYHGCPNPWNGPKPRKSIALYYYTSTIPEGFEVNDKSTYFVPRPQDNWSEEKYKLRDERAKGRLKSNIIESKMK